MNTFIFITMILYLVNSVYSTSNNYGIRIRNTSLRIFVLKDKKTMKIFKEFKKFYELCYNKSVASIGKGISDYNSNLSEDDRIIIETIISLCY